MKYWREIIIVVLLLVVAGLASDCSGNGNKTKITRTIKDTVVVIKGAEGLFDKPDNISEIPSKGPDSVRIGTRIIYTLNPVDKKIREELENAKDSIDILNIAIKAGQIRENVTDFSNQDLELKVHTTVAGELKDVQVKYKIPDKEVTVKTETITIEKTIEKKDKFGVLLGGNYVHPLDNSTNNSAAYGVNAGVRLGKVSLIGGANTNKQATAQLIYEF